MRSGSEVGFGIVGAGGIGRWHARVLKGLLHAKAVGVTDLDPHRAAAVAGDFGLKKYADLDLLLRDEEVRVVSVCTPPDAHLEAVLAAARAGRHVLVEKPLTPSVGEADLAIEACRSAGVHLGVVHQQRARSGVRAAARLLREGRLGRIATAAVVHTWFRCPSGPDGGSWRGNSRGGGFLHDQVVHGIDLLLYLLGPASWVAGSLATQATAVEKGKAGTESEDSAIGLIGLAGGALATLTASTVSNGHRDDIALQIHGDQGGVRLEIRDYDHAEIEWLDLSDQPGERARRLGRPEIETWVRREGGEWRAGPHRRPWRWLRAAAGTERGDSPFRSVRAALGRALDRRAQNETSEHQGHAAVLDWMARAALGTADRPLVTGEEARESLVVIEALRRSNASAGERIEVRP